MSVMLTMEGALSFFDNTVGRSFNCYYREDLELQK